MAAVAWSPIGPPDTSLSSEEISPRATAAGTRGSAVGMPRSAAGNVAVRFTSERIRRLE